jgi:hypothetical protein
MPDPAARGEPDDVAVWLAAIRADPGAYRLPAYEPISAERAAGLFAVWAADEARGAPTPPLCRRCGRVLAVRDRRGQQLHVGCRPPPPPGTADDDG